MCSSQGRREKKFFPCGADQNLLIKARLGITPTTRYKCIYKHLDRPSVWIDKCAACLNNSKGDLCHFMTQCSSNHKYRKNNRLTPFLVDGFPIEFAYLSLLSDWFLSHPYRDLHVSPLHRVANLIRIPLKKSQIRLSPTRVRVLRIKDCCNVQKVLAGSLPRNESANPQSRTRVGWPPAPVP